MKQYNKLQAPFAKLLSYTIIPDSALQKDIILQEAKEMRQMFSLTDNLEEINAVNEYSIRTTRTYLHNVLCIMYFITG